VSTIKESYLIHILFLVLKKWLLELVWGEEEVQDSFGFQIWLWLYGLLKESLEVFGCHRAFWSIYPYKNYKMQRIGKNGPDKMQRIGDHLFADLPSAFVYIDDVLFATETFFQHLQVLQEVFCRIREACLRVSVKKV